MKKTLKPVMLSMAVALGITGISAGGAYAAPSTSELDWTYKVPSTLDVDSAFRFGNFAGDNLYLWAVEGRNSFMVQSFDQDNGDQDNWIYDFRGKTKQFTAGGQPQQDKDGNSYYFSKKSEDKSYKLEAVNAEGKLKWSIPLTGDAKIGNTLQVLDNGDIVVSYSTLPKKGEASQTFSTFGKDGKLKSTKVVKGSDIGNEGAMLTLLADGRVLAQSPKVQVFKSLNDLKKPVLEYAMPEWGSIDFDVRVSNFGPAIYSLSGGETLITIRTEDYSAVEFKEGVQDIDLDIVKQSKSLVLFDAKGNKKWERKLWKDAAVVPTANGFVLQKDNKLELYGKDNKLVTSKTFEGDDLWLAKSKTTDEIVLTSKKEGTFQALSAKDLSVKYEIDMKQTAGEKATYSFLYEGNGELYVHAVDGNVNKTVSHYELK